MVGRARRGPGAWALLALVALGSRCLGGDGGGGDPPRLPVESPDTRCVALPDPFGFPPGQAFVAGRNDRLLAATFSDPRVVPLDVSAPPFRVPADAASTPLPPDADGDGCVDAVQPVDDVFVPLPDLAWLTLSAIEGVLFLDPAGGLRSLRLEMPPDPGPDFDRTLSVDPAEFVRWPAAGGAEIRSGVPNSQCIVPPPGALDSAGEGLALGESQPADCGAGAPVAECPGFFGSFTAGAARAGGRLFAALSNLGARPGEADTQYLPSAVAVYDLDLSVDPPVVRPVATPDGGSFVLGAPDTFNFTHVQAFTDRRGREWLLATATGAIGIEPDDPDTGPVEAGAVRLSDGALEVFDPVALRRVARYRLPGANPAFRGAAIHPDGRVAALGDVTAKRVYALDLSPLETLPDPTPADAGEQDLSDHVLYGADDPLELPPRVDGPDERTCPGRVDSVAWSADGSRLFAIEVCDGSLTVVDYDGARAVPARGDFRVGTSLAVTAPLAPSSFGLPRQPAALRVRPGTPGVDFGGPDLFFLVNEPEGLVCGIETGGIP